MLNRDEGVFGNWFFFISSNRVSCWLDSEDLHVRGTIVVRDWMAGENLRFVSVDFKLCSLAEMIYEIAELGKGATQVMSSTDWGQVIWCWRHFGSVYDIGERNSRKRAYLANPTSKEYLAGEEAICFDNCIKRLVFAFDGVESEASHARSLNQICHEGFVDSIKGFGKVNSETRSYWFVVKNCLLWAIYFE